MNKLISVLALLVLVLPLSVTVLFSGQHNLLAASKQFFVRLFEQVVRFGIT
ncbi:hypothetical protein ACQCN2_21095 [Brevibacillus ginsengisoli]|uniref:hypothetical protein n=1 Tax=Brevibacillus ginsengisoli TaxID=363854 RepID=UPI003CF50FE9